MHDPARHALARVARGAAAAAAVSISLAAAGPAAGAGQAAGPPRLVSPQLTFTGRSPTGYTVTFRYYDPSASRVQIKGEWYFSAPQDTTTATSQGLLPSQWQPGDVPIAYPNSTLPNWPVADMTREPRTGDWTYTTPLPPGTFSYGFLVNCASSTGAGCTELADPANPPWNDGPSGTVGSAEPDSQVYVPADPEFAPVSYWWQSPARVRGHLTDVSYPSPESVTPPGQHPLAIYTPPGYDPHRTIRYPTLYLSHGAGGNEVDWSTQGAAASILDHLIDARLIQPMVVVMTDFNGLTSLPGGYVTDLLQDVIPYVQAHYDVSSQPDDRAFGGLSLGGSLANALLLTHTGDFGYYSVLSNAGPQLPPMSATLAATLQAVPGIQIGGGIQDPLRDYTTGEEAALATSGVPFTDDSVNGGHEWYVWRILLRDFLRTVAFRATMTTGTATVCRGGVAAVRVTVRADSTEPARPAGPVQLSADGRRAGRPFRITASAPEWARLQLGPGPHVVTASYGGDAYYRPSTSPAIRITC